MYKKVFPVMKILLVVSLFAAMIAHTPFAESPHPWPPSDSISWEWEYTGDVLPNEADVHWSTSLNAETDATIGPDGLRVVDRSAKQGSMRRYIRSWWVDPAAGGVVEASIKVIDNNQFCGVGLMLADSVHEAHLTLYPDSVDMNNGAATYAMDTTDDFHTYRLATQGENFILWVDGLLAIDGTGMHTYPAHASRCHISFGSGASAAISDTVYAAVRYAPFSEQPMPDRVPGAQDVVIYKEAGVYACFPSMYRTETGDLVASFATRSRRSHIDGTGGGATTSWIGEFRVR